MRTEVVSCDVCMATIVQRTNGASDYAERGGGFSISGWEEGVTEYVNFEVCSATCLANVIQQVTARTGSAGA